MTLKRPAYNNKWVEFLIVAEQADCSVTMDKIDIGHHEMLPHTTAQITCISTVDSRSNGAVV